jgi:hypothetical protein
MSDEKRNLLVHNVYFTLHDDSPEAARRLVEACYKYLQNHAGVVYFAAGTLVGDLTRPVNVRDFHVGLHVVFADRRAHDEYQTSPNHVQFIEENRSTWKQVRVFDTTV